MYLVALAMAEITKGIQYFQVIRRAMPRPLIPLNMILGWNLTILSCIRPVTNAPSAYLRQM